ncbi:malonyl-CoA O-methyltransferase [Candidatus Termititenax aidoneus]|uniref:Malonyl-[acyl-carrier protein] O-methyltransferase n=1 Tax=Termititenax aidoneus TaxID=2218524 RepID=A0A388T9U7_TERA1|nr:malonyl-CoA O-methyltransferase [Candidatus Termititenax aidoneus]
MPDKQRISSAFSRAAPEYDRRAVWQKQVARRLLARLGFRPANALDLGCGTGEMLALLAERFPGIKLSGLDSARGMIAQARERLRAYPQIVWQTGDMEHLPYPDQAFALIVSNLALQWLESPSRAFTEARRVLRAEGCFLFTTLASGTLQELRAAYKKVCGQADNLHKFLPAAQIRAALSEQGFSIEYFSAETETQYFPDLRSLLRSMQSVGAKNPAPRPLSKTQWQALQENYLQIDGQYPLTYEVVFALARKAA